MKNRSLAVVVVALTAFATPLTFAQNSSSLSSSSLDQLGNSDHPSDAWKSSNDMKDIKQIRASKLICINVTSKNGENLGQVQDLVINPDGKIQFALVGPGFMAGLGQSLIPVPWQAVQVRSEREFALNVDKSRMQSAPTWSQSDYDQPDYVIRVYRFFEIPQTDVGTSGSDNEQSGTGQGSSEHLDQNQSGRTSQGSLYQPPHSPAPKE